MNKYDNVEHWSLTEICIKRRYCFEEIRENQIECERDIESVVKHFNSKKILTHNSLILTSNYQA